MFRPELDPTKFRNPDSDPIISLKPDPDLTLFQKPGPDATKTHGSGLDPQPWIKLSKLCKRKYEFIFLQNSQFFEKFAIAQANL